MRGAQLEGRKGKLRCLRWFPFLPDLTLDFINTQKSPRKGAWGIFRWDYFPAAPLAEDLLLTVLRISTMRFCSARVPMVKINAATVQCR